MRGFRRYLSKARVDLTPEQRYEARMAMRGRTSDSAEDHPGGESGSRYEVYEENCPNCGHPLHGIHRVHPNGTVDPRAVSYDDDPNEAEEIADRKSAENAYKSQAACSCCGDKECSCNPDCAGCDCNRPLKKYGVSADTKQHGVMVALYPDPKVARSLAIPGGEDPKEIHLTLGYFGDDANLSPAQQSALKNLTHQLATKLAGFPLEGRISGLGYFQQPESDQEVLYASVDVPGLNSVYNWLLTRCRAKGLPMSGDHGFTPHLTLTYQQRGTPRPKRATPLPNVAFTPQSLVCKIGEKRHTFEPGDTSCPECGFEDCKCIELADVTKSLRGYLSRV